MGHLIVEPNIADRDGFYAALLKAHAGLSPEAGAALNARLVLLLANHVGDADALGEALAIAVGSLADTAPPHEA